MFEGIEPWVMWIFNVTIKALLHHFKFKRSLKPISRKRFKRKEGALLELFCSGFLIVHRVLEADVAKVLEMKRLVGLLNQKDLL